MTIFAILKNMKSNRDYRKFNIQKMPLNKVFLNFLGNLFFVYCIIISIALIFFSVVTIENEVDGPSMQPTLNKMGENKHDYVYVNIYDHDFDYEDIIVLNNGGIKVIKRIVGLPGDKIDIVFDGHQFRLERNGEIINEYYIFIDSNPSTASSRKNGMHNTSDDFLELKRTKPECFEGGKYVIKDNEVFVLGDNRLVSVDSADYGAVSMDSIDGIVERIKYYGDNTFAFYYNYIRNGEFIKTLINVF